MNPSRLRYRRDARIARASAQDACGAHKLAEHNWSAAERHDRAIGPSVGEHAILLASLVDNFDEISDDMVRDAGGVVAQCGELRVVGLTFRQAWRQYSRIKREMLDRAIPAEPLEFVAKAVAVAMPLSSSLDSETA